MSIRLLGGLAKGMELVGPRENNHTSSIRPTSVMLKRRLFDSIQDFHGIEFIDLCSGTGSIGFEALSRGAEKVICVDQSPMAIKLLKQNQKSLVRYGLDTQRISIQKQDSLKWLTTQFKPDPKLETIVFYDPPYENVKGYSEIYHFMTENKHQVKLIMEACSQKTMPIKLFEEKFSGNVKTFKQGTSFFIIYDFE